MLRKDLGSMRGCAALARAVALLVAAAVAPPASSVAVASPAAAPALARPDPRSGAAYGDASVFLQRYLAFRGRQLASGSPDTLTVPLGVVKPTSRSFSGAAGALTIDLGSGEFRVTLRGLTPGETYTLRLVDQPDGGGAERSVTLAAVHAAHETAEVSGRLDPAASAGVEVDRAVVTRGDATSDVVASGSVSVLQKLFFHRRALRVRGAGAPALDERTRAPALAKLVPGVATVGGEAAAVAIDDLIRDGARVFTTETFGGNGRTCATCHPPSNDFTIDPAFIAGLPPDDPLFVAERVPELARLERPRLMREFGLILENLDGLDAPDEKFVMRSVSHTIGLPVSLQADTSLPGGPAQMTGWSGDGAPGAGTLRDFATGAVTQHLTRTMSRVPGEDFVPPTERQLDALEAFQLSIGRDFDPDLSTMSFLAPDVEAGKVLFVDGTGDPRAGGRCNACHANGGALNSSGENRNFDTNVEDVPHPAQAMEAYPRDGGFGQGEDGGGSFGDSEFNTPSVIEAADTPPFFHNNLVSTLEEVVRFYTRPEFNDPRDEDARFAFDDVQVGQVADFMRALNVLQNLADSRRALGALLEHGDAHPDAAPRLEAARLDAGDAIRVLGEGHLHPDAVAEVSRARELVVLAQHAGSEPDVRSHVEQAIARLDAARALIVASP
jgi:cytochrome c peroxidase